MATDDTASEVPAPAGACPPDHRTIGVVVERRKLDNPWLDHAWAPASVLPAAPPIAPWTRLTAEERLETYYAGQIDLRLYRSETGHYRDNLAAARPRVWVALRPTGGEDHEIAAATVNPYEGEAMAEAMGDIVEALPMPPEIMAWVEAFVAAFHVERPFFKRKRDRIDPNALGRRGRGGSEER